MGLSERIIGLTKYMVTLPKTKISVFLILIISILTGGIVECLTPGLSTNSVVYSFLDGAATTFFLLGLTTIASGGLIHSIVNKLNGRHVKLKQAMFLAFVYMLITCFFYLLGAIITLIIHIDITSNTLLLGLLFGFAIETLVLWATSNIRYFQGVIISAIQPILTISMWVLINNLTAATTANIYSLYLKAIIGALVLAIAVYAFVSVIESPIKSNLGVGGLELLSLFIAQVTEGSIAMEEVFSEMGEDIDTIVSLISFKTKNGIKANFISPCIHPGPVGNIGGGNMPTILSNQLEDFAIVAHGAATHDFNPVASKEVSKITDAINNVLPELTYTDKATEFQRVQFNDAKIGVQFFDEGAILLSTFAPNPGDDIDYGVGLSMIYQTKYMTNIKDVVLVDCHNCLNGNYERLLPGHNRVYQIEKAIDKITKPEMYPIKMGYAYNPLDEIPIKDGIGESGVKLMITEVNNQKMLYIVFDGNNMQTGFREKMFEAIKNKYPEIDMMETMTTDTHMVNTISGGGLTVGFKHEEKLIQAILDLIPEALNDLEQVSVASSTARVNIKTLGPNNSTELVTTISSVVSVSKLLAPLVFIIAAITTIIWIF
ncbi:MAG: DUF2070 family protein [Methanosphaera sp.]|uniref:DUF2070 family protein n=1 Tax=Methanosphaera sp. ISO3-F5 TaxID=1452353 RepID=UPI002B264044|nr:DUF2070 family protein [Methanosphaera sp. ISO3-F5]MBR0473075.1 DUF2070 family protein [Methanosphaera sp.]WQH63519.1 DUF2070 family protein [Methanosphaera sp. ISO3-F5]